MSSFVFCVFSLVFLRLIIVPMPETAASRYAVAIRSGTGSWTLVRRQAARMTKVSSMPMPSMRKGAARLMPMKSTPMYMHRPKAAKEARIADTTPSRPAQFNNNLLSMIAIYLLRAIFGVGKLR